MKTKCLIEIWSYEESSRDPHFQNLRTILGAKLKKRKEKWPVQAHSENMGNTL